MDLGSVTLIVKAPNHQIEDKTIAGDLGWTVKQLKEHISTIYPERPREDQQKLVYYGKLLQDDHYLKDVLKQEYYDGAHTVHLVCPQHMSSKLPAPYASTFDFSQSDGVRQRRAATAPIAPIPYPSMQPLAGYTPGAANQWTVQQHMWMQMYYQQMAAYQEMYQQMAAQSVPAASQTGNGEPVIQAETQPEPAAAPARPDANEDIVLNAQGGVEDEPQRDWLDSVYSLIRILMLFCLLYFYTTLERFSIVLAIALFFYLAQGGLGRFFYPQRRGRAPEPRQEQAENQNNENDENEEPDRPASAPQPAQPSVLRVAKTFITTFFSSLIPQAPEAVVN